MHFPGKDGPKKPIHLKLLPKNFRMLQLLESSLDITSDVKSGCFDGILRNAYPKKATILDGFCLLGKKRPRIFQDAQRQHQAIIESVTGQPCFAVLLLVRLRGVTGSHFLYQDFIMFFIP